MGFNINLARRDDSGVYRDVPRAKDFPAPGWDPGRYGWDREYYVDLLNSTSERVWRMVWSDDDRYHTEEECFRPDAASLEALASKFPENPRCQRLVDLLLTDDKLVIYST